MNSKPSALCTHRGYRDFGEKNRGERNDGETWDAVNFSRLVLPVDSRSVVE